MEVNAKMSEERLSALSSFNVKLMCETRWVEQHNVLAEFAEMCKPTCCLFGGYWQQFRW